MANYEPSHLDLHFLQMCLFGSAELKGLNKKLPFFVFSPFLWEMTPNDPQGLTDTKLPTRVDMLLNKNSDEQLYIFR